MFSGHRDILGQPNSGNFLAIIELLANYDPVLQKPFEYLSPSIQNELIYILSQRVQWDIIAEKNQANKALFFPSDYGYYSGSV